ncbi:MarR family transcriptional regulator [Leifsonia sp. Le1]|uniref:MarR family transcriptional regulator n=1 Tax=Leifsonia sp. Le1 TaxID=3404918 RepID=UPI003EB798D9
MDKLNGLLSATVAISGHNGGMPSRRDSPEMPPRAAAVHQAVSGTSRLITLRFLLENPGATRTHLVEETGLTPSTARVTLRELETLGYIAADVEGENRNGRAVHYSARRDVLTDDLTAFVAWMLR